MMRRFCLWTLGLMSLIMAKEAPLGSPVAPSGKEQAALQALAGQVKGVIVWSSSRANAKHDIWKMKADGTDPKALTSGDAVDWFPRLSPDGQTVLFTRSKGGWVPEVDADIPTKWDLWTVSIQGGEPQKVVENATWGTWRPDGKTLVYSRAGQVYSRALAGGEETLLLDGEKVFKTGVILQEPNQSPDGKYLAITLRGTMRETGVWNFAQQKWVKSGEGCQIDWFAKGHKIYRVNPTGNGGTAAPSEILWFDWKDGQQIGKVGFFGVPKANRMMDLPGRRSHEYFPRVDAQGKYLVWGATDKGHDHDLYDYELYLWKIGDPVEKATRLTFHSGNDRWPDIRIEN